MKIRTLISIIALGLSLVRCSGGGSGEEPAATPRLANDPAPAAPTEFLVATSAGLWRGLTTGQGGIVFERPNLQQATVLLSEGNVLYSRGDPQRSEYIWTVRTDGTGDHALFNAPVQSERLLGVSGPWALVSKWLESGTSQRWSVRPDTGEQYFLSDEGSFINDVRITTQGTNRVIPFTSTHLFSVTLTGTNRIEYDTARGDPDSYFIVVLVIADSVVYMIRGEPPTYPPAVLFARPASGGTRVQFEPDQFYTYPFGSIGSRLIYQRCSGDFPNLFSCDVLSANPDNTGKVMLADQSSNEVVQGVTTNQVIFRRNLAGNDQLIAVPVTGGTERLLMTMTDNEFVDSTVGDLIIVRRPTGTWKLDLTGKLTQLGSRLGLDTFHVVGASICSDLGEVWCMPLDGSGPEVRIDRNGKIVGVL